MENINFSTEFKKFVNDVDSSGFDERIKELQDNILSDTEYKCFVNYCENSDNNYFEVEVDAYNYDDDDKKSFSDRLKLSTYDPEAVLKAKNFIFCCLTYDIPLFDWKEKNEKIRNEILSDDFGKKVEENFATHYPEASCKSLNTFMEIDKENNSIVVELHINKEGKKFSASEKIPYSDPERILKARIVIEKLISDSISFYEGAK